MEDFVITINESLPNKETFLLLNGASLDDIDF